MIDLDFFFNFLKFVEMDTMKTRIALFLFLPTEKNVT